MKKVLKDLKLSHIALFVCFVLIITTFAFQFKLENTVNEIMKAGNSNSAPVLESVSEVTTHKDENIEPTDSATQTTEVIQTIAEYESLKASGTDKNVTTSKPTIKPTTTKDSTKEESKTTTEKETEFDSVLVLNINSKKIHSRDCGYAGSIKEENRAEISLSQLSSYLADGYEMCSKCKGYKK